MCLILSENWTMTSGRDLPALVRWAREAEDAGFDSVMISEHIGLLPGAVIAPLRHPLLMARELGSLDLLSGGRLVVLPTVSWLEDEYRALGVPFRSRGD